MLLRKPSGLPLDNVHLEWIQLRHMGWSGILGRYPLHFHQVGTAAGSWVRNVLVRDSYHRGIVLHDTHDVVVENNVTFETKGYGYYVERTPVAAPQIPPRCRNNAFRDNLGVSSRLRPEDDPPSPAEAQHATFWITDNENEFTRNVAAGSMGSGFWYELPFAEWAGVPAPPRFDDNVAHSHEWDGFHCGDRQYWAGSTAPTNNRFTFRNFTSWKNRRGGVWHRQYGTGEFVGARLADNQVGAYLASEGIQEDVQKYGIAAAKYPMTGAPGMSMIELVDSLVIGESSNPGSSFTRSWELAIGRSLPDSRDQNRAIVGVNVYDGTIAVRNTVFANFQTRTSLPALGNAAYPPNWAYHVQTTLHEAAFAPEGFVDFVNAGWHPGNQWAVDARNRIHAVTFVNAQPAYFWAPPTDPTSPPSRANGVKSTLLLDQDNSLFGNPAGVPPRFLTALESVLFDPQWSLFVPQWNALSTGSADATVPPCFGQLTISSMAPLSGMAIKLVVQPTTPSRATQPTSEFRLIETTPPVPRLWPFTVLLEGSSSAMEEYRITPVGDGVQRPHDFATGAFDVALRFGPANKGTIVELDMTNHAMPVGVPITVTKRGPETTVPPYLPVTTNAVLAPSLAALRVPGNTHDYFVSGTSLYLKLVLGPSTGGIDPVFDGREIVFHVP